MSSCPFIFAYAATEKSLSRLENSVRQQLEIEINISELSWLVTDCKAENLPCIITDYFCHRILTLDAFVLDEHGFMAFCLARLRNASIQIAEEHDATWLVFCDADTVIARVASPDNSIEFANPSVYWQKSSEETVLQSLKYINENGYLAFSEGNSWFMLNKNIYRRHTFNENMVGYGWEDLEFVARLKSENIVNHRSEMQIIHIYHTDEDRAVNWWQFERNRMIFECTNFSLSQGLEMNWQNIEVLGTDHPHWKAYLFFNHKTKTVVHPLNKSFGKYSLDGSSIIISWADWAPERFERIGNGLSYAGTVGLTTER
ncbi:hypothetical protein [Methylobacterium sp. WL9]|uniref:hypothetical protein n=1 Tax=Methylobacterium sp. WL9 TaxID=2603898 RepID=UPI0011CBBE5C|nr:hypothetical protein [Methylobacterium sp. WL9]TXN20064.1 hypothetical protein FV217_19345 [Methylobacterium sp. WL9]